MNTPHQSQPEQTVENILANLAWSGKYTDAGQEVVSAGEVSQAKQALNRQALATALRLIGNDIEPPEVNIAVVEGAIGFHVRLELNKYKAELRQAFTDYYGGGEV